MRELSLTECERVSGGINREEVFAGIGLAAGSIAALAAAPVTLPVAASVALSIAADAGFFMIMDGLGAFDGSGTGGGFADTGDHEFYN